MLTCHGSGVDIVYNVPRARTHPFAPPVTEIQNLLYLIAELLASVRKKNSGQLILQ